MLPPLTRLILPALLAGTRAVAVDPVDFRHAPPEWQTAICLPDDPHKTLVDRGGELLYHYGRSERGFATRIGVEACSDAVWRKQELHSPRVPVVRTLRTAGQLEILEESFAVTDLAPSAAPPPLSRVDTGGVLRDWARPPAGLDPALRHIAVHMGGEIRFRAAVPAGAARRIAMALCEGWWKENGKRVQRLTAEGAAPRTVDCVADIGPNRAAAYWFDAKDADGDGAIDIAVEAAEGGADKNTILNGLWVFAADRAPASDALLAGKLDSAALARLRPGEPEGPPRNDVILVTVSNPGTEPRTLQPRLTVDTILAFGFRPESPPQVTINGHETLTCSLRMTGVSQESPSRRAVRLEPLAVPANGSASFFVLHAAGGTIARQPESVAQAVAARERAVAWWQQAALPFGRVQVPDPGIQALLDSSVRNIWQAREIKRGLPAFQVGPTCYRGLWIVDGAFLLESATLLGAGGEARSGVAYELTFQQADGRIEVMRDFSKENGIVLWTCVRHARLTRDKAWLESVWPKLARVAGHIRTLRQRTLENDTPLDDGLVPPGFPDGGIGGVHPEYTNPCWNLVGLKAFVEGARWLGRDEEAAVWQAEHDSFMAAFRAAAERDLAEDGRGNRYLPAIMGEPGKRELPQRGQWAFCHAVYPGRLFAKDDPLVTGTLAMLEATEREGMVHGTGWDADGIWNYFASFYGHAWLWQGRADKAAQALHAFANHAAPTAVWREEQSLQGQPFRKVGDMPHNWASAEFIRLAVHLLALDRGDELHLLEGFPPEWARPGMVTRLNGVETPFGPLHLEVAVPADGRGARVKLARLAADPPSRVVLHLGGLTGRNETVELPVDRDAVHAIAR